MCTFHDKYIASKFDSKLLFTDTENLVYEIKTEDIYEDFYQYKNFFDFSDYSLDSRIFDSVNKNVTGKMKDKYERKIKVNDVAIN